MPPKGHFTLTTVIQSAQLADLCFTELPSLVLLVRMGHSRYSALDLEAEAQQWPYCRLCLETGLGEGGLQR